MRKIVFCSHAEEKFEILEKHGFKISREKVLDALENSDRIEKSYGGRLAAQKILDNKHVLRVIFEKKNNTNLIITFYPGRRSHYES